MSAGVATGFVTGIQPARASVPAARDRVLLAGFHSEAGQGIATALADRGARLVVQAGCASDAVAIATGRLAGRAHAISLYTGALATRADALATTQAAIRSLGGLDAAVIVMDVTRETLAAAVRSGGLEDAVADALGAPLEMIRVAANRMGVTWTRGTIVVVLVEPDGLCARSQLAFGVIKAALAGMVRGEAARLAGDEIRIVAVGAAAAPEAGCIPHVGDLVAALTGSAEAALSGVMFEAVA
ncbi:MAG: SDR family oxidoreductase [Hyphomicrobiaceae bacterium]